MSSGEQEYRQRLEQIIAEDPRYPAAAYDFLRDAVSYTGKKLTDKGNPEQRLHISGQQLLEGIRGFALEQFGPLSVDVFNEWGITRTEDFGNIVFNLVGNGLLGASEEDSPEDFAGGYEFEHAFVTPFAETKHPAEDLPKIA